MSVYLEHRNGHCANCGYHFFSSTDPAGPLCCHCKRAGVRCKVCGERFAKEHGHSWEKTCASTWPTFPVLHGHTDEASAYVVDDYPYGFRERTQIRYWIETTKRGQRFCSQTRNPKTGRWNKAKKSTYADVMVMVLDEEGHVSYTGLHTWASECELQRMERLLGEYITEAQRKTIHQHRIMNRAAKHITVDVRPAAPGESHQTDDEKWAVWSRAIAHELRRGEQDEPA
jgi:hypothetical protein